MKKAQGVSLTVIIVAILALLVLVVLAAIFVGKTGTTVQGFNDCENKGGDCQAGPNCEAGYVKMAAYSCPTKDDVCCLPIGAKK